MLPRPPLGWCEYSSPRPSLLYKIRYWFQYAIWRIRRLFVRSPRTDPAAVLKMFDQQREFAETAVIGEKFAIDFSNLVTDPPPSIEGIQHAKDVFQHKLDAAAFFDGMASAIAAVPEISLGLMPTLQQMIQTAGGLQADADVRRSQTYFTILAMAPCDVCNRKMGYREGPPETLAMCEHFLSRLKQVKDGTVKLEELRITDVYLKQFGFDIEILPTDPMA